MKKIEDFEGHRTKTGFHTGYAVFLDKKGDYYLSQESGLRKLTSKEIRRLPCKK